jgi:hypothetical protein
MAGRLAHGEYSEKRLRSIYFFMIGPVPFPYLSTGKIRDEKDKGIFNIDTFIKRLLNSKMRFTASRITMEHSNHQKWENAGLACPLCKHPDVHFLKETGVWVCNHCQYTWHTIEGRSLR